MLGVLVALVKIADYATVIPGMALFVLGVLVFLLAAMQASFDPREVWERIEWADDGAARARREPPWPRGRHERDRAHRDAHGACRAATPAVCSRVRPRARHEGRCPRCDDAARVPQARQHPAHLGLPDRRGDLLHPGQPASRVDHDHRHRRRVRHHPARRRAAVVADRMAAVAHRAGREHHDPEREDPGAGVSADHVATGLGRE